MAKMFYTLKEAAQKLGVNEQAVTDMIASGKLNKFNDGGQSVLKRDQIDAIAGKADAPKPTASGPVEDKNNASSDSSIIELVDDDDQTPPPAKTDDKPQENSPKNASDSSGFDIPLSGTVEGISLSGTAIPLSGTVEGMPLSGTAMPIVGHNDDSFLDDPASSGSGVSLSLNDSSDTDAVNISDDTLTGSGSDQSSQSQSGVDIFETGEVDAANTMEQTQVSDAEDELNLESVGSGSGLLDLTQESDDTSLGADLLDEIYPGEDDSKSGESVGGSVFDSGAGESGFGELGQEQEIEQEEDSQSHAGAMINLGTTYDPAGSGFVGGLALGAIVALIAGLVVTIAALSNNTSPLTQSMSSSLQYLGIWCVGLLLLSIVLAFIGRAISKSMAR